MGIASEFQTFIRRGNVIDLAVGVIIGAAFTKIVTSLVEDVLTPPIGWVAGGVNFTAIRIHLGGPPDHPATINVGNFIQAVINFFLVAICVFALVKAVNYVKRPLDQPATAPELTTQEKLLTEIRDLLRDRAAPVSQSPGSPEFS